jgi:hypothetical protein
MGGRLGEGQWALQTPTFTGWLFYVLNLIPVIIHIVSMTMLLSGKGTLAGLSLRTTITGALQHGVLICLHLLLGMHAFFNVRLIRVDGTVPWYMLVIIGSLAGLAPVYLRFAHKDLLDGKVPPPRWLTRRTRRDQRKGDERGVDN